MLVAVSILAISLSILIYHHPPSTWPAYFIPAPGSVVPKQPQKSEDEDRPATQQQPELQGQANGDIALEEASPATTPKATASKANAPAIPSFTLEEHHSSSDSEDEDNLPPPSFPALNSAQRASKPAPPVFAVQPPAPPTTNGSMAPPAKPSTSHSFMAP